MNNNNMSTIDFSLIGLTIPENVNNLSKEEQEDIYNYLYQMSDTHKKAYVIALNHLGTSFNILKSNGYKEWKKQQKK